MSNQDNQSKLTDAQRQKLKKYAVYALMGIICAGSMFFIFTPSAKEKAAQQQQSGFNADIPDPRNEGLIGDRRDAHEHEQMRQRQAERMRSLHDFGALLNNGSASLTNRETDGDLALLPEETATARVSTTRQPARNEASMQRSMDAYHDVNRTLGNFYQTPSYDTERERLQRELDDLRQRLDDQESEQNAVDMQMALMERSLQMAAQHFPAGMTVENTAPSVEVSENQPNENRNISDKTQVVPVSHVSAQVVSALPQSMTAEDFIEAFSQPRNVAFHTATNPIMSLPPNTVAAVVHTDQTIAGGDNVRLRLSEAMLAGNVLIPRNSLLSGVARIQGERLQIAITSIEHNGTILTVDIAVFDTDGQRGIFIPNSQEISAAKEIVANMGTNAGTSINLSNDAGEQFLTDMGRNAIQGVSQLFSRRMREVRVHLKEGYRVLLKAP